MSSISPSHIEEVDDTVNPPAVTEVGFKRMTLVMSDVCLTHSATAAQNHDYAAISRLDQLFDSSFEAEMLMQIT